MRLSISHSLIVKYSKCLSYQCQHLKLYFHFIKASSFHSAHVTRATIKKHSYIWGKLNFSLPPKVKSYPITEYAHFWNMFHKLTITFLILFPNTYEIWGHRLWSKQKWVHKADNLCNLVALSGGWAFSHPVCFSL